MPTDLQVLRDAVFPQTRNEAFGFLVLVEHSTLATPLRVTNIEGTFDETLQSFVLAAQGQTWITTPFSITAPGQSEEEPQGSITIPNVDRRIGEALAGMRTPAVLTITPVLYSNPEVSIAEPYRNLKLRGVETDVMEVSGELTLALLETEPFCVEAVTESRFPAVFRASQ